MNPFKKNRKQKSIFITAGYPNIDSLADQIAILEKHDIDFIEVGIPFSDPLADGPVIQRTSEIAIANGMNLALTFEQLKHIKAKVPIVLMGYLNPVLNFGVENFAKACEEQQIASVILPDMSIEIYERFYQKVFEKYHVSITFLITPETPESRIIKTFKHCRNSFVYLVSGNSTTGSGNSIELDDAVFSKIKLLAEDTPLMIGFGIKSSEDIERVHAFSDGAIIGSAYLKALENHRELEFLAQL